MTKTINLPFVIVLDYPESRYVDNLIRFRSILEWLKNNEWFGEYRVDWYANLKCEDDDHVIRFSFLTKEAYDEFVRIGEDKLMSKLTWGVVL